MFPFVPRERRKQRLSLAAVDTPPKDQNAIGGLKDTLKAKLALRMELFLLASIVIAPSTETRRDIHPRGQLWLLKQIETVEFSGSVDESPAVSWAAVVAGAVAAAALTLVLLAFGAGMGFSSVSPWGNSGVSTSTFQISAGIYLIVVAMLASTIGGFIAGRLRTK
jgi:hypothetical protein